MEQTQHYTLLTVHNYVLTTFKQEHKMCYGLSLTLTLSVQRMAASDV